MSQFPLRSPLLCTVCLRLAFRPRHLGADGTFLPPPSLCFFLIPSSVFCFLFACSPAMSVCHTSCCMRSLLAKRYCLLSVIFVLPLAVYLHYKHLKDVRPS